MITQSYNCLISIFFIYFISSCFISFFDVQVRQYWNNIENGSRWNLSDMVLCGTYIKNANCPKLTNHEHMKHAHIKCLCSCVIMYFTRYHIFGSRGPWFNINLSSCQNRKSHCGDNTVKRSSYLHNGISYNTSKVASLYWTNPWWRHSNTLMSLCEENPPVTCGSPHKGIIMWSYLTLNVRGDRVISV